MLRNDRGQPAAEYMGVLLIVSLLVAALVTSGVATGMSGQVEHLICAIAGQACEGPAPPPAPRRWAADRLAELAPIVERRAARWRARATRRPRSTAATSTRPAS